MALDEAHDFDGYELYPLSLRCPRFEEEEDLQRLHSELERASPSVFVDDSDDCQVGVFEAILASSERSTRNLEQSTPTSHEGRLHQEKLSYTCISSLREMKDTLRVNVPDLNTMKPNVTTIERTATRQYETSVSMRSRSSLLALKNAVHVTELALKYTQTI